MARITSNPPRRPDSFFARQEPANDNDVAARRVLLEAQVYLQNANARLEVLLLDLRPANDVAKLEELLKEYLGSLPTERPPRRR